MDRKPEQRRGYTLVEIIVVLAILATMAAVAIPTFAKMGAFSRDDLGVSSRDVLGILKAARVYSATFRTEAAVVYTLGSRNDSRDGAPQFVADGIGMARKMTGQEFRDFGLDPNRYPPDDAYAIVENPEGRIRALKNETCVRAEINGTSIGIDDQLLAMESNSSKQGLVPVRLFQISRNAGAPQADEITPRDGLEDLDLWKGTATQLPKYFPAHVFKPSGEMRTSAATARARFLVTVAFAPDAKVKTRFMDPDIAVPRQEVSGVRIELNKFSGRAQMNDE